MDRRYSTVLTVILIVIIVAVIGLLAFLGYNTYTNSHTKGDAKDAVDTFNSDAVEVEAEADSSSNTQVGDVSTNSTDSSTTTSASKPTYKGFEMLGTIEIPKTGAKYPVLAKVTDKALKTSVGVVYPTDAVLNTVGNIVISGHNYRNGTFFSDNKKIANGDKIYITDLNKKKVTYIVYKVYEADSTDTSFYNRDTNGKKEITLSTCVDNVSQTDKRLIVQAREE